MKAYIAGPFFNESQIMALTLVEQCLEMQGVEFYSPFRHNLCLPDAPKEAKTQAFINNNVQVCAADVIVAILEYPIPGAELHAIHRIGGAQIVPKDNTKFLKLEMPQMEIVVHKSGPVELPDIGTVFELGVAHKHGTPILGFHRHPKKMNLMLAECLRGFVDSYQLLTHFFAEATMNWELAKVLDEEVE